MIKLNKTTIRIFIWPFLAVFAIVFLAYWPFLLTFFQQDEWFWFGRAIVAKGEFLSELFKVQGGTHLTPISNFVYFLWYWLFGLKTLPYELLSLFLHVLNSFLVFLIFRRILRNFYLALFSSFLFATYLFGQQGVTWLGTAFWTELFSIFSLISILAFEQYLKNSKILFLFICLGALLLGLFSKETASFLFIFLPLSLLIYPASSRTKKIGLLTTVILGIIYGLFRFYLQSLSEQPIFDFKTLASNLLTVSVSGFGQLFLSASFLLDFSSKFNISLATVSLAAGGLTLAISILVISIFFWLGYKREAKYLTWAVLFAFSSLIPHGLIPNPGTILDSRFLYLSSAGAVIIVVIIIKRILPSPIILNILILGLAALQTFYLWQIIPARIALDKERAEFTMKIKEILPSLPANSIIYAQTDKPGGNSPGLPFQNGFGQVMMVLYSNSQHTYADILKEGSFWDYNFQGYRESTQEGFGYFYNFDKLAEEFGKHPNLTLDNIFAFTYKTENKIIEDKTTLAHTVLKNILENKQREIENRKSWQAFSSGSSQPNPALAIDNNFQTSWVSPQIPHKYLTLDLKKVSKVSSVVLDYQDANSYPLGSNLEFSRDGKNWQDIPYIGRAPTEKNKMVWYFEPQETRFIRIKLNKSRNLFLWQVSEIHIFEIKD